LSEKEHLLLWEEEVIMYLLQILSVLCHLMSDHCVAHRDLKLNNIMWKRAEGLRLIDFGTATEDIRASDMCGNIAHVAPEVIAAPRGVS
jgi:serine/threonine protein kinase